jgi:hypothetical protein
MTEAADNSLILKPSFTSSSSGKRRLLCQRRVTNCSVNPDSRTRNLQTSTIPKKNARNRGLNMQEAE